MTDPSHELDALATALGRRADEREQDERDPRWEAVARGELAVEDALAEDADDPDAERAAAYFRPFDEGERGSLVDGLLAVVSDEAGAEVVPLRAPGKPADEPADKPRHDPGSSSFWWIPGGMLVAAAAAILMWWVWPPSDDVRGLTSGDPEIAKLEPIPEYVLETDGGLEELRGDTGGPEAGRHRYERATPFSWVLRPRVDEAGEVAVRGFAFVDGGSAGLPLALGELVEIAESGAIRITGTIEQLDLEPGRYTIALAVGRPAALPEQAAALEQPSADGAWQVRRIDIDIED